MSFDSLGSISGFILIISILLIAFGLEVFASKKRIGICMLIFSVICFSASLKIFCSIDDDLYHSSNKSYNIKLCDMYTDNDVLMAKDRYNISYDGFDSDIKVWSYNTEKVKEFYNTYNIFEHYYDYLEVKSSQQKITPSVLSSLMFTNKTLKDFVSQDINVVPNTGVITKTGKIRSYNKDGKNYYIFDEYLFCGQDVDGKISKLADKGDVTLKFVYDKSYANGNEFFKYKIA